MPLLSTCVMWPACCAVIGRRVKWLMIDNTRECLGEQGLEACAVQGSCVCLHLASLPAYGASRTLPSRLPALTGLTVIICTPGDNTPSHVDCSLVLSPMHAFSWTGTSATWIDAPAQTPWDTFTELLSSTLFTTQLTHVWLHQKHLPSVAFFGLL